MKMKNISEIEATDNNLHQLHIEINDFIKNIEDNLMQIETS